MSQLVDLELGDELFLNDPTTQSNEISWFNAFQTNFTNTILYINNYQGQVSDSTLVTMIQQAHCDLICFDYYPFQSAYDTNYPNDIGAPNTGPYNSWLGTLRQYRQDAWQNGVPFGTYMQTFNSVEGYDQRVYRNPSLSELRYNNFSALAFNAKLLIGFVYNSGAAALFNILPNGYSGDTYTNTLYNEQADVNHRAVILGRTLACLQPVYDLHNPSDANPPPGPASAYTSFPDGTTTSIVIAKGNPGTTTNTGEPIGFQDDHVNPKQYSWFEFGKNDPYLHDWTVQNMGTNNGGSPGQVIFSWFKPLDENLDGPNYTNEVYVMVVNALTANNGAASNCLQRISLNFSNLPPNIASVDMLDLEGGSVTTTPLPFLGRNQSIRQLVLNLNGGDAAFFKYSDGAPFIGHVAPARPQLSVALQSGHPAMTVQGTSLARYEVQSSPTPNGPNWSPVGYRVLTNSSAVFLDPWASQTNATFYRAIGIP